MSLPVLNENEARVLGCLLEKSITTPDQYPLTLNALCNACNQKSAREPVMNLDKGEVERAALDLSDRKLLKIEENFKSGVKKYDQRLCNTGIHGFQFEAPELAIICLLLLRGPQTPGELRARSGRLHEFADNSAALAALLALSEREDGGLVVQLPRSPGRKDSEYMHLLSGPVDVDSYEPKPATSTASSSSIAAVEMAELAERVTTLERELAELKVRLDG